MASTRSWTWWAAVTWSSPWSSGWPPIGSTRSPTSRPWSKHGVKSEGNAVGASASTLAELADLIARGELEVPIAARYPLEQVRDAYRELAENHTRGKIVLEPSS